MEAALKINQTSRIIRNHIPFELDGGIAERAAIGVIVLGTDQTIEHEFREFLDIDGVAFYESRIRNSATITPETLADMEHRIPECTEVILKDVPLDVIAYGCTSASMVIGEERVFERIREKRPDVRCTTPITAAFAAFSALNAKNLAVLTPYREDVNDAVAAYIEDNGFNVVAFGSFNEEDDNKTARISTDSIRDAAIELGQIDDVDLVFVSCTNLRIAPVVNAIEQAIGKPATSSNHAMAWHCLRLAGVHDRLPQFGRLYNV
ncbi:MAG: hypothetical protein OXI60_09560 [Acidiferrobacterales bacterium]|nr:hypothetical protein [Acidiferrobacterales bacterium]